MNINLAGAQSEPTFELIYFKNVSQYFSKMHLLHRKVVQKVAIRKNQHLRFCASFSRHERVFPVTKRFFPVGLKIICVLRPLNKRFQWSEMFFQSVKHFCCPIKHESIEIQSWRSKLILEDFYSKFLKFGG